MLVLTWQASLSSLRGLHVLSLFEKSFLYRYRFSNWTLGPTDSTTVRIKEGRIGASGIAGS